VYHCHQRRGHAYTDTDRDAYTDSNRQAVADAEIGAYPKAAPNSPAETVGFCCLWLFEIALVFVRFDHLARFIVNANHSII
jgi:hypothetical protein